MATSSPLLGETETALVSAGHHHDDEEEHRHSLHEVAHLADIWGPDDPDVRKAILKRDYTITFPSKPDLFIKIENLTPLSKQRVGRDGEELTNFFGMITKMGEAHDLELAKTLKHIQAAGCYTHSYSAKSGTNYRVTRIGISELRLRRFADDIDFVRGFDEAKIEAACRALEPPLELENPPTSGPGAHPEAKDWYRPYQHLCGPFKQRLAHLYAPLTGGERMKIARLLMTGDSHLVGDAKGCGLDIAKMEEEGQAEDGGFCLAFYPLHATDEKEALEAKWMPLKLGHLLTDYKTYEILPCDAIMEYFGEEIGFYFAFLSHYVYCLLPMVPIATAFQAWQVWELWRGTVRMFSSAVASLVFTVAYSLILNKWKCDQSAIAHRWHAYDSHSRIPPRPGFQGIILKNPATGKIEVDFPASERKRKVIQTLAVSLSLTLLLLGGVVLIFFYRYTLSKSNASSGELMIPPVLNAVQITVFGIVYGKVAEALTEFENHKTILEFNSALFRKLVFCCTVC